MLPSLHYQAYGEFLEALQSLQRLCATPNPDVPCLRDSFQQVQLVFEKQITILNSNVSTWQSIQTELHRSMRLLATDMMFLGSSRTAATSQQRRVSMSDRIEKMIGYCQLLISTRQS